MDHWDIGLDVAAIQAGLYGDFSREQYAAFALSFSMSALEPASLATTTAKTAVPLGGGAYRVTGEVVYLAEGMCVLDFGLCAYQPSLEGLSPGLGAGAFVTAEVALAVDNPPFDQGLFTLPDIPPLVYTWYVHRIADVVPAGAAGDAHGTSGGNGDEGDDRPRYEEIDGTDAWARDADASYVLSCTRMDYPPRYVRVLPWERVTSEPDESAPDGRVLRFPEDRAVGLLTRYVENGGVGTGKDRWEVCEAARGMVALPPDLWPGLTVPPTVADLSPLAALGADALWRVDLSASPIDNEQLAHLRGLTGLRELALGDAAGIDDAGVYHLRRLSALQDLDLAGTGVTDDGLTYLHALSALQTLTLTGTPVTAEGVAVLRRALPACTVYSGVEGARSL